MDKRIIFAIMAVVYFFGGFVLFASLARDGGVGIGAGVLLSILMLKFIYPKF